MRRRRYLKRISAGLSVGIAGLAGCGAPGEETGTGTEATAAEETTGGGATEIATNETTAGEGANATTATEQEAAGGNQTQAGNQTTTGNGTQTGTGTTTGGGAPNEVAMITEGSDYIFNPIGLYVEPGETITWVLESGSHSSTAYTQENPQSSVNRIPNAAEGWDSGILSEQGAEFTYTFEVQGTYDYYCIPHKSLGMVARIVCGEPSGLDGNPPDGPVPSEQKIVEQGVVTQEEFNP